MMRYVGFLIAMIYLVLGVTVLLRSNEFYNFSKDYTIPLGSVLIAYGLFRGYRVYQRYFWK